MPARPADTLVCRGPGEDTGHAGAAFGPVRQRLVDWLAVHGLAVGNGAT